MESAILLLVGGIIGVLCDRIYKRFFETVPLVSIHPSTSYGIDGHKFLLEITNVGSCPLPPYEVWLYNPHRGSIGLFTPEVASERLPLQKDTWAFMYHDANACLLDALSSKAIMVEGEMRRPMPPEKGVPMSDKELGEWTLRLVAAHSDNRVWFSDRKCGNAVVEILRDIRQRQGQINPNGEQLWRVHATNSWKAKVVRWYGIQWNRIRGRL